MPSKKVLFIRALRQTGDVTKSAHIVDWHRTTAYFHRYKDSEFESRWNQAIEEYEEEWRREVEKTIAVLS